MPPAGGYTEPARVPAAVSAAPRGRVRGCRDWARDEGGSTGAWHVQARTLTGETRSRPNPAAGAGPATGLDDGGQLLASTLAPWLRVS